MAARRRVAVDAVMRTVSAVEVVRRKRSTTSACAPARTRVRVARPGATCPLSCPTRCPLAFGREGHIAAHADPSALARRAPVRGTWSRSQVAESIAHATGSVPALTDPGGRGRPVRRVGSRKNTCVSVRAGSPCGQRRHVACRGGGCASRPITRGTLRKPGRDGARVRYHRSPSRPLTIWTAARPHWEERVAAVRRHPRRCCDCPSRRRRCVVQSRDDPDRVVRVPPWGAAARGAVCRSAVKAGDRPAVNSVITPCRTGDRQPERIAARRHGRSRRAGGAERIRRTTLPA